MLGPRLLHQMRKGSEAGSILPRGSAQMQRALLRAVPEVDVREVVQETSMPRVPNRAGEGSHVPRIEYQNRFREGF